MSGSRRRWVACALLAVALAGQTLRAAERVQASRLLRRVEAVTIAAVAAGRGSPALFQANLRLLERAAELDPREVGVPLARGSQHLLRGRPHAAIAAYREALALEPRPEVHLNLGRAYRMAGDPETAAEHFATAALLDPRLGRTR